MASKLLACWPVLVISLCGVAADKTKELRVEGDFCDPSDQDRDDEIADISTSLLQVTHHLSPTLGQSTNSSVRQQQLGLFSKSDHYWFKMEDPIKHKSTGIELMVCGMALVSSLCWVFSAPVQKGSMSSPVKPPPEAGATSSPAQALLGSAGPTVGRKAKIIKALDGLRVIFISQVIINHFYGFSHIPVLPPLMANALSDYGYPAGLPQVTPFNVPPGLALILSKWFQHEPMRFFATLSGFIRMITNKAPDGYDLAGSQIYCARVIARFAPPYWLALVWVGLRIDWSKPFITWPTQASFLQGLFPIEMDYCASGAFMVSGNFISWFTSGIVLSSCMFPLLWNACLRAGTEREPGRALAAVLVLIGFRAFCFSGTETSEKSAYSIAFDFLIGVLCAQLCYHFPERLVTWSGWGYVFDATLVAFYGLGIYIGEDYSVFKSGLCKVFRILSVFIWPLLIVSGWASAQDPESNGAPSSGLVGKLVSTKPITFFAQFSFGAYIYQIAVLYTPSPIKSLSWWPFYATWGVAMLSEYVLERYIRNMIEARIKGTNAKGIDTKGTGTGVKAANH